MGLNDLVYSGLEQRPPRVIIHSAHGVGKNTLAASMPAPIILQTEDGSGQIDCPKLPLCKTFQEVMDQMTMVYKEDHQYKTLVVDSLDWMETLVHRHVCQELEVADITDVGYGGGYNHALGEFERVIKGLSALHEQGMAICLLAHSQIKTFQNLLGEDYDRHIIKLRDKVSDKFNEFVDVIGYLHLRTFTHTQKKGFTETVKAIGGSERVFSCQPHAAFESKNRFGITDDITIPLNNGWDEIYKLLK